MAVAKADVDDYKTQRKIACILGEKPSYITKEWLRDAKDQLRTVTETYRIAQNMVHGYFNKADDFNIVYRKLYDAEKTIEEIKTKENIVTKPEELKR